MGKSGMFQGKKGVSFPGAGGLAQMAQETRKHGNRKTTGSASAGKKGVREGPGEKTERKKNLGFKMNKTFGQHLLKNPGVVTKIIEAADIKKSDTVLEIGPGTGNLTVKLCPLARKVRAVEIDPRMVAEVKKRVLAQGYSNLEVKQGDALTADYGEFQVCTANLPYQISSPFIFRLLSVTKNAFRCAVLMFQKEFGERLVALPGEKNYCRLGVNAQLFCTITRVCLVAKSSFNPPPKVDSIVVKFSPKRIQQQINYSQWDGMLRLVFCRKRRTLRAIFRTTKTARKLLDFHKAYLAVRGDAVQQSSTDMVDAETAEVKAFKDKMEAILNECEFAQRRAVEMSIPEFCTLLAAFNSQGIFFVTPKNKNGEDAIPESLFINDAQENDDAGNDDEDEDMAD